MIQLSDAPQEFQPRWNYYRCPKCHHMFVTVEIHEGVTPMFLRCRNRGGCPGQMHSAMYLPVENWPLVVRREADGEWYSPGERERRKMKRKYPALYEHVKAGGLILRKPRPNTPAFPGPTLQGE